MTADEAREFLRQHPVAPDIRIYRVKITHPEDPFERCLEHHELLERPVLVLDLDSATVMIGVDVIASALTFAPKDVSPIGTFVFDLCSKIPLVVPGTVVPAVFSIVSTTGAVVPCAVAGLGDNDTIGILRNASDSLSTRTIQAFCAITAAE